jgi:predicted dehydrogenase
MIRYITGLEVTKAYADYGALETPFETEDSISVTLRYDNQAIGNIVASSVVRGTPLRQLRIWGSDGQVTLASQSNYFYTLRQIEDYRPGEWHSFGELPKVSNRKEFVTRFARAILKGEAPEMTAESGWAVQAVSDAIYTSGELGRAVAPETLDSQERVLEAQKTV